MTATTRWAAVILMLLIVAASAETLAWAIGWITPERFRQSAEQIRRDGTQAQYDEWLRTRYDAELGWLNPRATTFRGPNCAGEVVTSTFDRNGARISEPLSRVDVIAVGDSFTRGDDVSDAQTYPNWIGRLTGLRVANYGVGASGPLQQVMYFERLVKAHPEFKAAVLGIMYEDLLRLPARLRYVFAPHEIPFYFKPWLDVTKVPPEPRPNPNVPPAKTVEELRPRIEAALRDDYLARPELSFPYTVAVVKMLLGRRSRYGLRNRRSSDVLGWFEDDALIRGLDYVVGRFIKTAREHGALPVVAFIPGTGVYLRSPDEFIAKLHGDAVLLNVGAAPIDWQRYNVRRPDGSRCHPSAYGYEMIAQAIVDAMRRHLPPLATAS